MRTLTCSGSRARSAEILESVVNDRDEVIITRPGHDPVVIVSLDDCQSLKVAVHLSWSPGSARRVFATIDNLEHGGGAGRDLVE